MNLAPPHPPRILLLAHSCNPEYGSDPGAGWNWARQLSKYFPVCVLCDEEYNRGAIEQFCSRHGSIENLTFAYVPAAKHDEWLRRIPATYYLRYRLWHGRAIQIARRLHEQLNFDLVHQLNLNGFREPGYLWKLDAPFVWGPVGGAQNYPWRFVPSAGLAGAAQEVVRSALNLWQAKVTRRIGLAARKAKVVLGASMVNAEAMARRSHRPAKVLLEIGVSPPPAPVERQFRHGGPLRILWSGVFEHRKALHLLFQALAALPKNIEFELQILGRGPLEKRWRRIASQLQIEDRCRWLGWLNHTEALDRFRWADVFVFSSLRDTTGTVVLESLAAGTPIICFDHQGAGEVVTNNCGIKLPVTNPKDAVSRLATTLQCCHEDRDMLERFSRGAYERAQHYAWDRQGQRMAEIYRQVLGISDLQTIQSISAPAIDHRLAEVGQPASCS
jgi:glycosyltransferase involved in cell wall biosynthesis